MIEHSGTRVCSGTEISVPLATRDGEEVRGRSGTNIHDGHGHATQALCLLPACNGHNKRV